MTTSPAAQLTDSVRDDLLVDGGGAFIASKLTVADAPVGVQVNSGA